jgi:long-chain acyl-CoA synthetase
MNDAGLLDRFARLARDGPERILVHVPSASRAITARDLQRAGRTLGRALARAGVGRDDLLVTVLGNHPAYCALLLATIELGVAILPLDRGTPRAEAVELAARFGARALVVDDTLGAEPDEPLAEGVSLQRIDIAARGAILPRGTAMLKLTSGSTGLPNAAIATAANLVADGDAIIDAMGIRPDDVQVACIPMSHSYGIGNLVMPLLLQGTSLVLHDQFNPSRLVQDAAAHGTRVLAGVPFMFDHLLACLPPGGWPPPLRLLVTAGARLEAATARGFVERFGVRLHSFYGSSETGGITFDRVADPDAGVSVGTPLPHVRLALRPEPGAAPGTGRVHVSGPAVSTGYADASGEADSPFVDGGFLTGDLARLDEKGGLVLSGRVSSFINVAGLKVSPDEVERVLREMPEIADARVVGVPDPVRGQLLVGCVVPRNPDVRPIAIRRFCADRLSAHKIPRAFVMVEELPRTARGKTDRRALDALVRARLGAGEP